MTDLVKRKLIDAGYLNEKEGDLNPISSLGVKVLLSHYVKQQKLEYVISITFLEEVIQSEDEKLYSSSEDTVIQSEDEKLCSSSEDTFSGIINTCSIVVQRDPEKSKSKMELQTRSSSSSLSDDSDEEIEKQKKARYQEVGAKLCAEIPEIVRRAGKPLNFVVWSSHEHLSLVAECGNNFYFLDSCGYYFQRFPVEDRVQGLIAGQNAFHIESQIQADDLTCGSYCVEFVKKLTERFLLSDRRQQDFNEYMRQFFINKDGSEFNTGSFIEGRTYGLVPTELLVYFQSLKFLNDIQGYLMREYNEELKKSKKDITDSQIVIKETKERISVLREQYEQQLASTEYKKLSLEVKELAKKSIVIPKLEEDGSNKAEVNAAKEFKKEYQKKCCKLKLLPNTLIVLEKQVKELEEKIEEFSLKEKSRGESVKEKIRRINDVQPKILEKLPKEEKIQNKLIGKAREEHLKELLMLSKAAEVPKKARAISPLQYR